MKPEIAVRRALLWRAAGYWILGLFGICLMPLGWFITHYPGTNLDPVALASTAIYLCLTIVGYLMGLYNSLIDARNRVRKADANIDVSLKRRADLVPMLHDVVEGLRTHETSLQTGLAALRAASCDGPTLRLIGEKYPALIAQPAFADFMTRLTDTEDRIALARSFYAESAAFYNTRIQHFPVNLGAEIMGFRALPQAAQGT